MKINRIASLFVALSLLASTVVGLTTTASAAGNPNCNAVDGDYIVSFAKDVAVDKEIKSAPGRSISTKFIYKNVLNGFTATLSAEQVCAFQKRPNIESIELDGIVSIEASQTNPTWGLDRIDQSIKPLSQTYSYTSSGLGVTAYVIDTGIQSTHPDLIGAVVPGFSAIKGGGTEDCNGHGTHVAGTIGGDTYGVAKDVRLIPVRVLDCRGSGSTSGVIAGIDWVKTNYLANKTMSVANMSLGGGVSAALDAAVDNLITAGVAVVVAAGNSSADACNTSPARVPSAITVAASDINDVFASFSNRGTCVDVIAPGVSITSAWKKSGVKTISGTSMASPHVAGVAVRYLQQNSSATPAGVSSALLANATSGVITGTPAGTQNLLIYANPSS